MTTGKALNVKFYVVAITAVLALSAAAETLPLIVWGTLAEEDATKLCR